MRYTPSGNSSDSPTDDATAVSSTLGVVVATDGGSPILVHGCPPQNPSTNAWVSVSVVRSVN